jgi:phage replication O-like protein O
LAKVIPFVLELDYMANPQIEDGHSDIANELLDAVIRTHFTPTENAIFWTVIRKTYGWHKKFDRISFTQFEESTGLSRRHIAPALQGLIKRNIISRQGEGYRLEYGIQKDYDAWQSLPKSVTNIITNNSNESLPDLVTIFGPESLPILVQSLPIPETIVTKISNKIITAPVTTKEKKTTILTKEITKDTIVKIPEWINLETWAAFLEVRKLKKAVSTEYALTCIIKDLEKFKASGDDPNECLNESIKNSWKGVFALKKNGGNGNGVYQGHNQSIPGNKPSGAFSGL